MARLEGEETSPTKTSNRLKVLYGRISLVAEYFVDVEALGGFLGVRNKLRAIGGIFVQKPNRSNDAGFYSASRIDLDPYAPLAGSKSLSKQGSR